MGAFSRFLLVAAFLVSTTVADDFRSHLPLRPMPEPSNRPLTIGPSFFVDPKDGNDLADGSKAEPWKSIAHALKQISAGDTRYLRGGT